MAMHERRARDIACRSRFSLLGDIRVTAPAKVYISYIHLCEFSETACQQQEHRPFRRLHAKISGQELSLPTAETKEGNTSSAAASKSATRPMGYGHNPSGYQKTSVTSGPEQTIRSWSTRMARSTPGVSVTIARPASSRKMKNALPAYSISSPSRA